MPSGRDSSWVCIEPMRMRLGSAAIYHDYGWITYETNPLVNEETGNPYKFLELPMKDRQLDAYQWCIDWMAATDVYSALVISRHRTGLWKGRYGFINHPHGKYD